MSKNKVNLTQDEILRKNLSDKKYREINREKINAKMRVWYGVNKEKIKEKRDKEKIKLSDKKTYKKNKNNPEFLEKKKERNRLYREKNKNNPEFLEKKKIANKKWKDKNPDYYNEYSNSRKKVDVVFKLTSLLKSSIYYHLNNKNFIKKHKTNSIIGCGYLEVKNYIESKFEPWMSWENYGKYNGELNYGWDIDHIIPLSSAKSEEELLKLFHFTNLQPLCSYTNRYIKKDKI